MNDEHNTNAEHPVGLYRDPESGQFVGAIDPIQADAMVRAGWVLFEAGREAAMATQEQIDVLRNPPEHDEQPQPQPTKKGK
jgi:hypothetical protein